MLKSKIKTTTKRQKHLKKALANPQEFFGLPKWTRYRKDEIKKELALIDLWLEKAEVIANGHRFSGSAFWDYFKTPIHGQLLDLHGEPTQTIEDPLSNGHGFGQVKFAYGPDARNFVLMAHGTFKVAEVINSNLGQRVFKYPEEFQTMETAILKAIELLHVDNCPDEISSF